MRARAHATTKGNSRGRAAVMRPRHCFSVSDERLTLIAADRIRWQLTVDPESAVRAAAEEQLKSG